MHYCGGKYVSTSINEEAQSCCEDACGCCENKTVHLEVEDDYVSPIQMNTPNNVPQDILFPILFAFNLEHSSELNDSAVVPTDTSPPPTIHKRLSLLQTYLC